MINPAPIIMYTFCLINSPHLINPPSPMPPLLYPNAFFSPFGFQQPTEGAPHHHVCSSVPWQTIPFQADPCFSLWLPMLSSVSWHGHVSPSSWVCKSHVSLSFILGLWHSVLGYLQWVLPPWLHLSSDTHIWLPFHMNSVLILVGLWHICRSGLPNESLLFFFGFQYHISFSLPVERAALFLMALRIILQERKKKKRENWKEDTLSSSLINNVPQETLLLLWLNSFQLTTFKIFDK